MTQDFLNDIEQQARAAGVSMATVLAEAGVNHSTWWRWRHGKSSPLISKLQDIQQALKRLKP